MLSIFGEASEKSEKPAAAGDDVELMKDLLASNGLDLEAYRLRREREAAEAEAERQRKELERVARVEERRRRAELAGGLLRSGHLSIVLDGGHVDTTNLTCGCGRELSAFTGELLLLAAAWDATNGEPELLVGYGTAGQGVPAVYTTCKCECGLRHTFFAQLVV